jgi:hypothetical protein
VRIEITEDRTHRDAVTTASKAILADQQVRQMFPKSDLWLVGFDVIDKDEEEPPGFSTIVHDTASGRSVRAEGDLEATGWLNIVPTAHQQPPGEEEFAWAAQRLRDHMDWKSVVAADGVSTYRPNPPLANIEHPDGSVERVVTIGLRTEGDPPAHRIVGVKTGDGDIVAQPVGVPKPATGECGSVPLEPGEVESVGPDAVRVRVSVDGGELPLWDLVVVRPRASSGLNGSGVELRNVDYKGQRVLSRAHLPIVTVAYGDEGRASGCASVARMWAREEASFVAAGSDVVPGFRLSDEAPQTILDQADVEAGDFRGVAFRGDGDDLVMVTQVQAGWDRYVIEWRLGADGTIRPRFSAGAVRNAWTCLPHTHSAHWRFDFDIVAPANVVQEHNETPVFGTSSWHTVRYEVARPGSGASRFWRVRSARSSQGYSVLAGGGDGESSVWILRYHDDEVDDGVGVTAAAAQAPAQLDWFVTGEPVHSQDVVVWYAASVDGSSAVGPDLVPSNWKEAGPAEVFTPLEPPTA